MLACRSGHIDIARMLLGEFHANINIQNTVKLIVRLVMCEHVFSGCARGRGGWECLVVTDYDTHFVLILSP